MAGASVFPVELSYGAHRRLHDAESEYTSYDIPVVIEVVDSSEKVAMLAGELDVMIGEGLFVLGQAHVVRYTHVAERGEDGRTDTLDSRKPDSSHENVAVRRERRGDHENRR